MKENKTNISTSINYEFFILGLILLAGSILRFWDYSNMQFMHDELSALSRLQFDNFSDLIREGVMLGDTHPAGVQVFLYYWTQLFGTGEMLVKLPFILSGILAIWVSYLIGKLWFDGTTGLLTAVCISSLQFFVMYSQIARPYVSGLLITLMMVYMWSLYFFRNRKPLYLILYVLFAAMAAYNHHFSLLFAAIVGISGLFFIRKKDFVPYALAGIAIFVLYIPHLNIFFNQLLKGGVGGWLARPNSTFILQFIDYLFHFSTFLWAVFIAVVMYITFVHGPKLIVDKAKQKRWLLFVWFILPIVIGYSYSVLRSPIIQYSMLIFSTPYLFILLFSYHKKLSGKQISLIVVLLMLVNITTLVSDRRHFNIFYKQPYEETFKTVLIKNNADDLFLIDDCIPYYHEYYFNKFDNRVPYFTKRNTDITLVGFENLVSNIKENTVVAEAVTGEELQIIQSYFPYQLAYDYGFTYEIYTFSRNKPVKEKLINREIIATTDFSNNIGDWKNVQDLIVNDSISGNSYCGMSTSDEWGPSITLDLSDIAEKGLGIIDVELGIMMLDTITKALIVATISEGSKTLYWTAKNFEDYNPEKHNWKKIYMSVDIQNALKSRSDMEGLVIKINVWNIKKSNLFINYIDIFKKTGNPIRYGLYNKL